MANHFFDIEHAQLYGLREAIIISNLHYWISHNHANGTHQHDGRTWTYNSVKAFEDLFPYLTYKQIRTSIDTLITQGVLVRGSYNKNASDRTSWFAFTDEFLERTPLPERIKNPEKKAKPFAPQGTSNCPTGQVQLPHRANAFAPQGKSNCPTGQITNIEQIVNTDVIADVTILSEALSALPALVDSLPLVDPKKVKEKELPDTELQAACKATWQAYSIAYKGRYGADPVRNAKVNSNVKEFVKRIGYSESPGVAAFYVTNISEAFVVRSCHALGTLLQNAEAYRTQWATGTSMTNTRARQIDQTQSNYSAVDEAIALMRARRAKIKAEGGSNE